MNPPQALLLVSFGGPEGPADVLPFLENVLRGRNVPRERRLEVAEHYSHFGGVSPIGAATRRMAQALQAEFERHGPPLRVYQGNRNWRPFLADTLRAMAADGVAHALALVTSAFGSYSGCRQYIEDMAAARVAAGPTAPVLRKLPLFYKHPRFIAMWAERVRAEMDQVGTAARLLFTAHSVPLAMAQCGPYEAQLREAAGLIAAASGVADWELAWQSRSGPSHQPWLEPDVIAVLRRLHTEGASRVVVAPLGFLSDHMEVVYDLDTEAQAACREMGLAMIRVATVGDHPQFAAMVRDLALADDWPDCAPDCCLIRDAQPRQPGGAL